MVGSDDRMKCAIDVNPQPNCAEELQMKLELADGIEPKVAFGDPMFTVKIEYMPPKPIKDHFEGSDVFDEAVKTPLYE